MNNGLTPSQFEFAKGALGGRLSSNMTDPTPLTPAGIAAALGGPLTGAEAASKVNLNMLALFETEALFEELSKRGGHPGALGRAALLVIAKSKDYNSSQSSKRPEDIDRSDYFPLGEASYAQMIHTKSQRFVELTKKILAGEKPNFEGLFDTALDLINYAAFYAAAAEKERPENA